MPFTTSSASAISGNVRAIGPRVERWPHVGGSSSPPGTTPCVGLNPQMPHTSDGMRIEPPPSEPVARVTIALDTATAEPPLDPPQVRPGAHGLRVGPKIRLFVSAWKPYAGVFVLPTTIAPAARRRATSTESCVAGGSAACAGSP